MLPEQLQFWITNITALPKTGIYILVASTAENFNACSSVFSFQDCVQTIPLLWYTET